VAATIRAPASSWCRRSAYQEKHRGSLAARCARHFVQKKTGEAGSSLLKSIKYVMAWTTETTPRGAGSGSIVNADGPDSAVH